MHRVAAPGRVTTGPAPAALVNDPNWLAHRYDPQHDAVHFIRVDREQRRAATFLTDEHLPATDAPVVVARRDAAAALAGAASPIHLVLHSAFCCSTLVARALDLPGVASALKEPVILNDLVGWRHRGGDPRMLADALGSAMRLMARPFAPGEAVVVKPSNVVNGLAPAMLALSPRIHALLLHAPLRLFLNSVARKGLEGRLWVRDLLLKQLKDGMIDLGFAQEDHLRHTDLQVAAVGWLAQQALFHRMIGRFGPMRVRSLDSETLLDRPAEAMTALGRLFGLAIDEAMAGEIAAGPAFMRHSKFSGAFDRAARMAEQAAADALHADEIRKVDVWAQAVAARAGVPLRLDAPLLPS